MSQRVLDYLAPWMRGQKGVVVTNQTFPKSADYDVIELHNHGNPGENGDNTYPWVLGTMFEQAHEPLAKTLRWLISHVDEDGILMVELSYSKYKPSQILDLIRMAVPELWIISSELRDGNTLLILRPRRPAQDARITFYIDNRPEVGDTLSLIPLIDRLHKEWENCTIYVRDDRHDLLPEEVKVCDPGCTWFDGVLHQWTNRNEFGDYYRRVDDFYFYPIRLAQNLGWLGTEATKLPTVPAIGKQLEGLATRDYMKHFKKNSYVVVAPHTNHSNRNWEDARWKHVIRWLIKAGVKVVLTGTERLDFDDDNVCHKFVNLGGLTTVQELGTIIKGARLVIGCDSSPIHLAMGHNTRAVVLQGPTAGAPLFRYNNVRSVQRKDGGCVNCFQRTGTSEPYAEGQQPPLFSCGGVQAMTCMSNISVTQVIDILREELLPHQGKEPAALSICMMVKNEAVALKAALESAVVAADEVILVDTGSTDDTIEIASSFGEKVHVYINTKIGFEDGVISDFSAARNFAFDQARSKYVMWLDAGDRIEDPEQLRKDVLAEKADVLYMPTVFCGDVYQRERVGPNGMVRFADRVHETMTIDGLSTCALAHVINHVVTKKVGREKSLERNVRLLKRMIEEAPRSSRRFRWYYYVARDLKHGGNRQEALKYFVQARDGHGFWEEQAHAAVEAARTYMELKRYQSALTAGFEALKHCDGWRDPYYIIGDAYYWLGDYAKAIPWFMHCLQVPKTETILWVWEDLYTWLPQCQLSYCHEKMGNSKDALLWAQEELKGVPAGQKSRVLDRIKSFGGQV